MAIAKWAKRNFLVVAIAVAIAAARPGPAWPQTADILCMPIECGTLRSLTQSEKDALQDPFFRLVLAPRPDVTKLADIEALIRGASGQRRFYVVHEEIRDSRRMGSRRAVVDFLGTNSGHRLNQNIFLSFFFTSDRVPESPDLEALSLDVSNGEFHYYKLDRVGSTGGKIWHLAATSRRADLLSASERGTSCLACHASGVPIMKELLFPWNNWHSGRSPAAYLTLSSPQDSRWPVTGDSHFADLASAESLESAMMGAIQHFNALKFDRLVTKDDQNRLVVADAKRLLRPLFETTEINLISPAQESNLHPLSGTPQTRPSQPVSIPNSFFLADAILASLGVDEVASFRTFTVRPDEYEALVEGAGLKIRPDNTPSAVAGDANFAWFTPELGFAMSNWIEVLLRKQVITPALAAAAIGADLENPVFSDGRARLLALVPPSFTATPGEAHPDALTREIVARLEAGNIPAGSVEAKFLALLKSPDPVAAVRADVSAYKSRIAQRLGGAAAARQAELQRLFGLLISRRVALQDHAIFGNLVESDALLPLP